jgi:hypothetical protein
VTVRGVALRVGVVDTEGETLEAEQVGRAGAETGALIEKRQILEVGFGGEAEREPRVTIECDNGYDLVISMLAPGVDVYG